MAPKFFLDAENGALAFEKLQDYGDVENALFIENAHTAMVSDPATTPIVADGVVLDVTNYAEALILIKPSDPADVYNLEIKKGINADNSGGTLSSNVDSDNIDLTGWYTIDGGDYDSLSGNFCIGVRTVGIEYLTVVFDTAPTSAANMMLLPIPYEETS